MKNNVLPAPRKLMRSVARAKMRRAGMRKGDRAQFFANDRQKDEIIRDYLDPKTAGYHTRRKSDCEPKKRKLHKKL